MNIEEAKSIFGWWYYDHRVDVSGSGEVFENDCCREDLERVFELGYHSRGKEIKQLKQEIEELKSKIKDK